MSVLNFVSNLFKGKSMPLEKIIKLADKELVPFRYETPKSFSSILNSMGSPNNSSSYSLMSTSRHTKPADKPKPEVWASTSNEDIIQGRAGLISSLLLAYSYHRTIVLSPDDFWILITQQVGKHILTYAEEYRSLFVSHQGQQEISVHIDEAVQKWGTRNINTWMNGVELITGEIHKRVQPSTSSIFIGDFSTTTAITRSAGQIVLMNAMKKYFSYRMCTDCGIPNVEMLGSVDDWKQLIIKAHELEKLVGQVKSKPGIEVTKWFHTLYPILDKLLDTASGNVDTKWWSHIADEKTTFGSGGTTKYYGWITKLVMYNSDGKLFSHAYGEIDDFPSGICACPFIFDDNGNEHKLNLIAGHGGSIIRESDGAVVPLIGWIVADRFED